MVYRENHTKKIRVIHGGIDTTTVTITNADVDAAQQGVVPTTIETGTTGIFKNFLMMMNTTLLTKLPCRRMKASMKTP